VGGVIKCFSELFVTVDLMILLVLW